MPAPPEVLFALWTEPVQLARWWAPDGYEPTVDALDVRPGGRWRTTLRASDGRVVATCGVYRIVDPPCRLVFTWAWEKPNGDPGHETEVSVSFEPAFLLDAASRGAGYFLASTSREAPNNGGKRCGPLCSV
jgi:uncharacterized protein YndB with AHSA1/START domain